jgi:hypothetical protein
MRGGTIGQAFADVVLEVPAGGGAVHAAPVTRAVLAAGLLSVPASARALRRPPPLPDPFALGRPEPTSAEPFAITLVMAVLLYGGAVARIRSRSRAAVTEPWQAGGTL